MVKNGDGIIIARNSCGSNFYLMPFQEKRHN